MEAGDYVKLKDHDDGGTITKILSKKKVEVALENGFTIKVDIDKIEGSEAPKPFQKSKKKPSVTIPPLKVDLHIEKLITNHKGMSNFDIVQIQLNEFERQLDAAIASGMLEITFIHGIGSGVLRQEIRNRLKNEKNVQSYMDAHFDRGATIVRFY